MTNVDKKFAELLSIIKNLETIFTLIGLPGAGKTSVMKLIGQHIDRSVVTTDIIFDQERAKTNGYITKKYVEFARIGGANREPIDINPAKLSNSEDFIGNYTNDRFRDYEDLLVRNLFLTGKFAGKLPDFSSSFYLRDENRKYLADKNIQIVNLNTPQEDVIEHLIIDTYKNFEKKKNGEPMSRDTLQAKIDAEISKGTTIDDAINKIIVQWSEGMQDRRKVFALSDITVTPNKKAKLKDNAISVLESIISHTL